MPNSILREDSPARCHHRERRQNMSATPELDSDPENKYKSRAKGSGPVCHSTAPKKKRVVKTSHEPNKIEECICRYPSCGDDKTSAISHSLEPQKADITENIEEDSGIHPVKQS